MKKFFTEFKAFALRGNVIDLAMAVIIGAAFQGIVASLTENILSPVLGLLVSENFDALSVTFFGVTLKYGAFITSVINFVIMAFVIFLLMKLIKAISGAKKPEVETSPATKMCPYCRTSIDPSATRCPHCTSVLE
ncbi:MAG: large conductance mechanosensitive channel protein MscL [Oscillospiraceae bacterium]|jgi:large conductance mechanosensitive channel|nr:large conductance mechanosensitive channel protein MscL [Oscillospiraceae bacterium]